ncbi:hypothetical protein [Haloplasma contractile]|uniref:AAA domain protein n=1 Tax=Haloplasma contractile SSD-17B TaxID=1033810 RepID=U2FIG9_9MOLU|nr:hypothetical protein [Haloplasma contractile]ERJ11009.1 AAA domain protein [Haloplasma contractile SSD-17B]
MKIDNKIIKEYLKNVYFITGTAYAGKSTICKMISERLGLSHCEENYKFGDFLNIATPDKFPNMCYFETMKDWQEFISRTPDEYDSWITNTSRELSQFEIVELISISRHKKVIVDTNIPVEVLLEISDFDHVALLLSPQSMSVERFFDREDPDKKFILEQINKSENPEKTMENYKACIAKINSLGHYNKLLNSAFKCFIRDDQNNDIEKRYQDVIKHFKL